MQKGASEASCVHCILLYTPPYLSCQEGGFFSTVSYPEHYRYRWQRRGRTEGKEEKGGVRSTENDCEAVSMLYPATE